jgi:K+-sensing histidine kinase KdpD
LELKNRIGIIKPQNDTIGLGLSCSKEICKKLGGDLKLKQSEKGMTIFTFKIPVSLQNQSDSFNTDELEEIDDD